MGKSDLNKFFFYALLFSPLFVLFLSSSFSGFSSPTVQTSKDSQIATSAATEPIRTTMKIYKDVFSGKNTLAPT